MLSSLDTERKPIDARFSALVIWTGTSWRVIHFLTTGWMRLDTAGNRTKKLPQDSRTQHHVNAGRGTQSNTRATPN
jgi:hypothetical protein